MLFIRMQYSNKSAQELPQIFVLRYPHASSTYFIRKLGFLVTTGSRDKLNVLKNIFTFLISCEPHICSTWVRLKLLLDFIVCSFLPIALFYRIIFLSPTFFLEIFRPSWRHKLSPSDSFKHTSAISEATKDFFCGSETWGETKWLTWDRILLL